MRRPHLYLIVALMLSLGACKPKPAPVQPKEVQEGPPERVVAAIAQLKGALGERLKGEIAKGGPIAAVDACRLEAPALTAAVDRPGLAVGRTSHRLRNPANKAPSWAEPAVNAGAGHLISEVKRRRVFKLGEGRRGYLEAIGVGALCVTCHGPTDAMAAPLAARLAAAYPEDQATGFAEGDLRGWFWVEYDARSR